jgi:S-adenosylmethionine:tRNA ribosyltransferase-isomerase
VEVGSKSSRDKWPSVLEFGNRRLSSTLPLPMRTDDFSYSLPPELIAQQPAVQRDESRLFVLHRATQNFEHRRFRDLLFFFRAGDVLVLNDSRVIRARLRGVNAQTGGAFEMLLLEENAANDWWAMMKPGKRARVGTRIHLQTATGTPTAIAAVVTATNTEGHRRLAFAGAGNILEELDQLGAIPLPPYIARDRHDAACNDHQRYQTVFAHPPGSVAAPTAGLHFTHQLLDEIRARGVAVHFITLHVGPGTFAPVKAKALADHVMHEERYELGDATARAVNEAKAAGRRVIAVGTTSVRVLESVAERHHGRLVAGSGRTRIFIYPPRAFRIVDALLTNFHLPGSTLLMLVSAFTSPGATQGRETILSAYAEAIRERYRFFSYGDAMLIL